ncbi:hypothetical protein GCM10009546_60200 [Actinomadura livida]|uniref:Uncharacterized protein n=1 Tax=Actinomadura livida TaxID=79909 RepID=A0ABN1FFM1_9ACTN
MTWGFALGEADLTVPAGGSNVLLAPRGSETPKGGRPEGNPLRTHQVETCLRLKKDALGRTIPELDEAGQIG